MESCHWWFVSKRNLVKYLIKALKISPAYILDVGSGTGGNILSFNEFGKTFGIDLYEKSINFCRKRGLKNIIQSQAEQMGYKDNTFDIITCLDILEHTLDPLKVLLEIKRVLKDTGKIIITVPAFNFLWSQHDVMYCHLRRYKRRAFIHNLQKAGFKIEKINYFFFTSFLIAAPSIMAQKLLRSKIFYPKAIYKLPHKLLNEFLYFLFKIEIKISDIFRLPFGTTLYAVVSKED